jgi:GNAT superfamily N-acetyltransferase
MRGSIERDLLKWSEVSAMLDNIMLIYHQVWEALAAGGLKDLIRKRAHWKRAATPVEMDLTTLPSTGDLLQGSGYRFVELKTAEIRAGEWSFALPSRRFKAFRYLRKGFRGFGVVEGRVVVGDIWCILPSEDGPTITHTDLDMLSISCSEGEAYAFDMLIDPAHRGKNLAVPLQRGLQSTLKVEGLKKVYGFYWDDNIPALWMHRMLKFKELPKRQVSRFFFIRFTKVIG